ncbi:hypothetical protein B0T25DRAFT_628171 [Lasiosphaeria hispida]|uniref:Glucose-methanol-choline oxidoreductase N-terminal domain-containing protein n=1 Tax=Lasiosphaeria hispida TaxID=260671 RepID=A0AAJ0ML65_9PEZI|nr:hypothetical protein B0T25DRAFT_628171 [Lasiosphaeria hispida]
MRFSKLQLIGSLALARWTFAAPHAHASVKREASKLGESYDFIVAGGGTSGLTVADRLTEAFPDKTVLVVEYGDIEYAAGIFDPPTTLWNGSLGLGSTFLFRSLPIPDLNNRSAVTVGGKLVGGSSAVNGMFFDRGSRFDYDAWAQAQAGERDFDESPEKWNWDGLFPFFKKSVTFTEPDADVAAAYGYTWDKSAYGGTTPIYASMPPFEWGDNGVAREAWKEMGVKVLTECAGGDKNGICWAPTSEHPVTARRSHAGIGHYSAVVGSRPNYEMLVKHQVTRVVYPGGDLKSGPPMVEVRAVNGSVLFNLTAKAEVILSAGVFNTPAILQRSGIGHQSIISRLGIPLVLDSPGVGLNLQDHSGPSLSWNYTKPTHFTPSPDDMLNSTFAAAALSAFDATPARGPFTLAMGNSGLFLSLPALSPTANQTTARIAALGITGPAQMYLHNLYMSAPALLTGYRHQLGALAALLSNPAAPSLEAVFATGTSVPLINLHPLSRGVVRVDPADPLGLPIVDYRTASNPLDMEVYLSHFRYLRGMVGTQALARHGAREATPPASGEGKGGEDEALVAWMRGSLTPSYMHACCTAAMLPRRFGGVVGPDLKVFGAAGLRVVDASVFPMLVGAHLSATAYAVAEKAADIIIRKWAE